MLFGMSAECAVRCLRTITCYVSMQGNHHYSALLVILPPTATSEHSEQLKNYDPVIKSQIRVACIALSFSLSSSCFSCQISICKNCSSPTLQRKAIEALFYPPHLSSYVHAILPPVHLRRQTQRRLSPMRKTPRYKRPLRARRIQILREVSTLLHRSHGCRFECWHERLR